MLTTILIFAAAIYTLIGMIFRLLLLEVFWKLLTLPIKVLKWIIKLSKKKKN